MRKIVDSEWRRSKSSEFPRVWHTFRAKDINSDNLVEYRIQDLPESRFDEAIKMMSTAFCRDEPICEAYDMANDAEAVEDLEMMWKSIVKQNSSLVCFKEGSDEIIGVNMNIVTGKNDHFLVEIVKQSQSVNNRNMFDILQLLYKDFDTYEHYGVDRYLTSFGLVVDGKYRGRRIGEQFLRSRRPFCEAFGIKLTSTIFTSNFSNKIADNVGFELNVVISYEDIRNKHPEFKLPHINSELLTLKTLVF